MLKKQCNIIEGAYAPAFTAQATSNRTITLSDYKDKKRIVLYFYPKDNTPGCTRESQDFAKQYPSFLAQHAEIFGVSSDNLESHEMFKAKYKLPFDLITDPDGSLCKLYDVKIKSIIIKKIRSIERTTFLIDLQGIIKHIWKPVKNVPGHVDEVFKVIEELYDQ